MKLLNIAEVQQVSGGDVAVTVSVNVPAADVNELGAVLGALLTEQLDASTLGNMLVNSASNFNDMPIQSITIGKFTITQSA